MTAAATERQSGPATIKLRDGRVFVADRAAIEGHRLTFIGRLRIKDLNGTRFYATRTRTFLLREVRGINWHRGGER